MSDEQADTVSPKQTIEGMAVKLSEGRMVGVYPAPDGLGYFLAFYRPGDTAFPPYAASEVVGEHVRTSVLVSKEAALALSQLLAYYDPDTEIFLAG